jgi:hypothetical protein
MYVNNLDGRILTRQTHTYLQLFLQCIFWFQLGKDINGTTLPIHTTMLLKRGENKPYKWPEMQSKAQGYGMNV